MKDVVVHLVQDSWRTIKLRNKIAFARGRAFIGDESDCVDNFAGELALAESAASLNDALGRLNGFYAWIEEGSTATRAAVDHVRSFPLFYGHLANTLFISDDANWVRQQVGDAMMDPVAKDEFRLAGYVTGRDTLYENVKQLQAGEWLEASRINDVLKVATGRHFRFWHSESETSDEPALSARLAAVTTNSFGRLVEFARGRQILVPLSGGYDSRLVAAMLKMLGYANVLCFTYGLRGNKEAEYSREVAETLGFRWAFVEYSSELWKEQWASQKAKEYRQFAANLSSLPHVQDWLAIKCLLESGQVDANAVVVPGHSGDFVAGSHIPPFTYEKNFHSEGSLLRALEVKHLSNAPKARTAFSDQALMTERLRDRIGAPFDGTAVGLANLFELWDWQERQAKYIINAVRVYDQFGLDWWLPLWDREFVSFWQGVPLALRKNRAWYRDWVCQFYSSVTQESKSLMGNSDDRHWIVSSVVSVAKMLPGPLPQLLKLVRARMSGEHFLAFEALVEPSHLKKFQSTGYNLIGMYSALYLDNDWGDR